MQRNDRRRFFAGFLAFLVPLSAVLALPAAVTLPSDKWFVIAIADVPVGYVHDVASRKRTDAGGGFLNPPGGRESEVLAYSSEMVMVLNRLGNKVEMRFLTASEETSSGRLLRETYEMKASLMTTRTEAVIKDGSIEFRSETGGKSYTRTITFTGEILGQEGIRLLSLQGLRKPGDTIEFQTFSPEIEAVTKGTRKVLAAETIVLNGASVPALKVEEIIEAAAARSTGWLDANHEVVRQEMPTPFGPGVFALADKALAMQAVRGGELPAEMYERSILRSNVRIPQARALGSMRVRLTARTPELGWPDFAGPNIGVVAKDAASLVLETRRARTPKAAPFPIAETDTDRDYLRPNATIQSDAADVRKLAKEVIGGEADVFRAAQKLQRWVAENMTFDLGIVLAPSSEIFANRRGTCLGYATLLATLARAAGIPSRVVLGYVYVLGMFGGHAWAEVRAGEEWIPIDAALPSDGPADAARIPLGATSFAEGGAALGGGRGIQLLGQIDIRVLEFGDAGGRKTPAPDDAVPYRIAGDVYANPWLGLELRKPADFQFGKADSVWPSAVVVDLVGKSGALTQGVRTDQSVVRVELQEHYLTPWRMGAAAAGDVLKRLGIKETATRTNFGPLSAFRTSAPLRAALVILDGAEAWALIADGAGASLTLDKIAAGLKIGPEK
jgi:hypothetical protein